MSRSPFWIDNAAFTEAFRKAGVLGSSAPTRQPRFGGMTSPAPLATPAPHPVGPPQQEPSRQEPPRQEPPAPPAPKAAPPPPAPTDYNDSETVEVPRLTRKALAEFQARQEQDEAAGKQDETEEEIDVAEPQPEPVKPTEEEHLAKEEAIPEFQNLDDHLQVRLAAFLDWIEKRTQAEGIFVVDDEGLILLERETDPDWVALSSYLMNFHKRIRKSFDVLSSASLAIDLEGGGILHWLYADTQLGPHVLGVFVKEPIPRKLSKSFQTTLAFVMRQASH